MQNPHEISARYIRQADRYNVSHHEPIAPPRGERITIWHWLYGLMIGVGFGLALYMGCAPVQ